MEKKTSRGFVGSPMEFEPEPHEARFENYDNMPAISSKFRRNDRAASFATQVVRDDRAIIKP